MLRVEFHASVPKELEQPELNEDALAIDEAAGRFAVSDGASTAYDSRIWANMLTARFLQSPVVNHEWVTALIREYRASYDFDQLSWIQQSGIEQGAFATLLAAEFQPERVELELLCVGDSLAVLVENGTALKTFPYSHAEQFDVDPTLLSTRSDANEFITASQFYSQHSTTWSLHNNSVVLLMTDALGKWLLEASVKDHSTLQQLLTIGSEEEFKQLVMTLRETKQIKVDDTTLVRLAFGVKV
ncbi:hypothetical protein DB032_19380 [Chromobacterium sp. Panama]|uniref:protein phosphatase 2C domain-containing protein n=1 Tax=Chromobacterium sp. Panama TaxID=2161826 RepID=UPI000D3264DD|nr:protein phosphatase 2C domain-containing protein [Chromobacterium sp. Panama]PTU66935.1 hypothetical protein DB032_19380 [Chromobacterium sp. Panama]